jgi:hypothetical protein
MARALALCYVIMAFVVGVDWSVVGSRVVWGATAAELLERKIDVGTGTFFSNMILF